MNLLNRRTFLGTIALLPVFGMSRGLNKIAETAPSKICFIGDSITHRSWWVHYIEAYFRTQADLINTKFINCGIGGNNCGDILKRLDFDVLVHKPTSAVIMIGMNDSRNNWNELKPDETIALREIVANLYYKQLTELINRLKLGGVKQLIICSPTPYDDTVQVEKEVIIGKSTMLERLVHQSKKVAEEQDVTWINFYDPMIAINQRKQKTDPTFTLISADRVHPFELGSEAMALLFLTQAKYLRGNMRQVRLYEDSQRVETIEVDQTLAKENNKNSFFLELTSGVIPYMVQHPELCDLLGLEDNFNRIIISCKTVKKGTYNLLLNGSDVGHFTSEKLQKGIAIDLCAVETLRSISNLLIAFCQEKVSLENQLRDLQFIEILYRNAGLTPEITEDNSLLLQKTTIPRRRLLIENYFKLKESEPILKQEIANIDKRVSKLISQQSIKFEIKKMT